MKFRITMKDPDGVSDSVADEAVKSVENFEELGRDERLSLIDAREEAMMECASKWFRFGEYVTIEIDTDAGTATVVPVKS